jgi:hypothetical protein
MTIDLADSSSHRSSSLLQSALQFWAKLWPIDLIVELYSQPDWREGRNRIAIVALLAFQSCDRCDDAENSRVVEAIVR